MFIRSRETSRRMKIKILFFAGLKEIFGPSRFLETREIQTIGEIVDLLTAESGKFFLEKTSLIYAVNENFESIEKKLENGDELALMTPLSGG